MFSIFSPKDVIMHTKRLPFLVFNICLCVDTPSDENIQFYLSFGSDLGSKNVPISSDLHNCLFFSP